jgi:hypothetical protein
VITHPQLRWAFLRGEAIDSALLVLVRRDQGRVRLDDHPAPEAPSQRRPTTGTDGGLLDQLPSAR